MKVSILLALLCSLLLTACSSKDWREREFNSIELGMSKSEVLDQAGPPHWSDRYDGYDRWIYYMNPERKHQERVVYFKQGVVIQKGLKEKPFLSAEEMEEVKAPRIKTKPYKRKYSDEQLKKIIKKEIQKKEGKPKESKLKKI